MFFIGGLLAGWTVEEFHGGCWSASSDGHDLGVEATFTPEDGEDDSLAASTAATFATHASRAELAYVDLDFAAWERPALLALAGRAFVDAQADVVDGSGRHATETGSVGHVEVQAERP